MKKALAALALTAIAVLTSSPAYAGEHHNQKQVQQSHKQESNRTNDRDRSNSVKPCNDKPAVTTTTAPKSIKSTTTTALPQVKTETPKPMKVEVQTGDEVENIPTTIVPVKVEAVVLAASSTPELAETGVDSWQLSILGLTLLAMGFACLLSLRIWPKEAE